MTRKAAYGSVSLTFGLAALLSAFGSPLIALGQAHSQAQGSPNLVQIVREATAQYVDVNNATAEGYGPLFGCVSGSDHGAMGIHYIKKSLLNPTTIDATHPQALIYEPSDGKMTLVGVEYIVDAATWMSKNSGPPVLEGQVFNFVDSPNRFTVAAFFELHVWAWRGNPQGSFVDWNNNVTCNGQ